MIYNSELVLGSERSTWLTIELSKNESHFTCDYSKNLDWSARLLLLLPNFAFILDVHVRFQAQRWNGDSQKGWCLTGMHRWCWICWDMHGIQIIRNLIVGLKWMIGLVSWLSCNSLCSLGGLILRCKNWSILSREVTSDRSGENYSDIKIR